MDVNGFEWVVVSGAIFATHENVDLSCSKEHEAEGSKCSKYL